MAGTNDDPFLENVAKCTFCLDYEASHLRRQWRRFGRLPAVDVPYGFTVAKLRDNHARSGCQGCEVLVKAIEHMLREFGIDFRHASFEYVDGDGIRGLSLTLALLYPVHANDAVLEMARAGPDLQVKIVTAPSRADPERKTEHRILSPAYELFLLRDQKAPVERPAQERTGLLAWPPRSCDTGSDAALQWAKAQIHHCRTQHTLCAAGDSDWKLPTRVLDLGEDLTLVFADPKLYETRGEQAPYVCLSHCWGKSTMLETTSLTIERFKQRIPWEQLPRTFQDAVGFTRRLGIRYLWIDSLCIIQHDADDWSAEAAHMASVYEHAELTLAAASSKDSRGGLFRQPRPEACLSEEQSIWLRQLPAPAFFKQPMLGRLGRNAFSDPDGASPLLRRGWVLQERLLSRRVLHFTPLELALECRVGTASESGHDWVDASVKHAFSIIYGAPTAALSASLPAMWRDLVELFTCLGLSYVEDTLPAMAGLAKRICKADGRDPLTYVAGLWNRGHGLLDDLLWQRSVYGPCKVNENMPTWSWARTDAAKSFLRMRGMAQLCEVVDAKCRPRRDGGDAFLHVDSGHIALSGFLIPAEETRTGVKVDSVPWVRHVVRRDYDWHEPTRSDPTIQDGDRLFFLPLVASVNNEDEITIAALALHRNPDDNEPGTYRRVGLANMKLLYLQPFRYILGGHDILLSHLRSQLALGESILKDGRYDEDTSGKPIWMREDKKHDFTLRHAAHFEYLCRYGGNEHPEVTEDEFLGRPHLDLLKRQLMDEEERLLDWQRRHEEVLAQVHGAQIIRII